MHAGTRVLTSLIFLLSFLFFLFFLFFKNHGRGENTLNTQTTLLDRRTSEWVRACACVWGRETPTVEKIEADAIIEIKG